MNAKLLIKKYALTFPVIAVMVMLIFMQQFVFAGRAEALSLDINLSAGQESEPSSAVESQSEATAQPLLKLDVPVLKIEVPAPVIKPEALKVELPEIKVETPLGGVETGGTKVDLPAVKVELPQVKAETPVVKTEIPEVKVDLQEPRVEAGPVKVETPLGGVETGGTKVDLKEPAVQLPSVKVETPVAGVELGGTKVDLAEPGVQLPGVKVETPIVKVEAGAPVIDIKEPAVTLPPVVVKPPTSATEPPAAPVKSVPAQPVSGSEDPVYTPAASAAIPVMSLDQGDGELASASPVSVLPEVQATSTPETQGLSVLSPLPTAASPAEEIVAVPASAVPSSGGPAKGSSAGISEEDGQASGIGEPAVSKAQPLRLPAEPPTAAFVYSSVAATAPVQGSSGSSAGSVGGGGAAGLTALLQNEAMNTLMRNPIHEFLREDQVGSNQWSQPPPGQPPQYISFSNGAY